jgi:hypothetical protein
MISILKTMLSDIAPKSFKSFFEGILLLAIVLAIITVVMTVLIIFVLGVAWLFGISPDASAFTVMGIILIGLWINSAYERTR